MNQQLLALACLATLAIAGCKPQAPAEPAETPADSAVQTSAATVATPVVEPPKTAMFDARTFAGTFSGTLPCASCPGIDTELELAADGAFQLDETYRDEKDGQRKVDGTWTAEANDQHIRLDPNSKSEDDRLYEIVSHEEIRVLGKDGKAPESTLNYSLKRDAVAK